MNSLLSSSQTFFYFSRTTYKQVYKMKKNSTMCLLCRSPVSILYMIYSHLLLRVFKWDRAVLALTSPSKTLTSGNVDLTACGQGAGASGCGSKVDTTPFLSTSLDFHPRNTLHQISGKPLPAAWPSNSLWGNEFKLPEKKLPLLSSHWLTSNCEVLRRDSKLQAVLHHRNSSPTGGAPQRAACQIYGTPGKHSSELTHFSPR